MSGASPGKCLILDANVLIDYARSNLSILTLVSRHIGQVIIPAPILEEVTDLSERRCRESGLQVVIPSLELIIEAAESRGRLSEGDHLCLLMAREAGHACVTNDVRLRKECVQQGVQQLWGLELMVALNRFGKLSTAAAEQVAKQIHESNPRFITREILIRFGQALAKK